jgi:hypothetical protein
MARQLAELLLEIPAKVQAFEQKAPSALPELLDWARRAERVLLDQRQVAAAELAGLRSRILTAALADPEQGLRGSGLRKRQIQVAVEQVHPMQACLQGVLAPQQERIEAARDVIRKLLQVLVQSRALAYDPAGGFELFIDRVWQLCTGHEQLRPTVAQLRGLLDTDDIRLILAEEIDLTEFRTEPRTPG